MVTDTTVTSTASRQWNIRISQFECSSRMLGEAKPTYSKVTTSSRHNSTYEIFVAPVGCLQYYLGASGELSSFNYKSEARANDEPHHLANLNYAICVRVENGYCGIRYSQLTSDPYSFTLSNDATPSKF